MANVAKVKAELEDLLRTSQKDLDALGPVRSSISEQAGYLIGIASAFQEMTKQAKTAQYSSPFFKDRSLRLATKIAHRGDSFKKLFRDYGHTHEFEEVSPASDDHDSVMEDADELPVEHSRKTKDVPGLRTILTPDKKLEGPTRGEIMAWLGEIYDDARGLELMSDAKLATTMEAQSEKWNDICHGYISDVIVMVHNFVLKLLGHVCPDEHVRRGLLALLEDKIVDGYRKASKNVEFNLDVELKKTPMTQNEKFNDQLQE